MPFDPDKFLAQPTQKAGFDPDAFLSGTSTFNPDKFLAEQTTLPDLSTLPYTPPADKQTASEALSSPDKRGIGEQLLSALFAPITPAARGVEALQALGAGGTEEETRGARAVNALLGREEVPAADVVTNLTGMDRSSLPDALLAKKMESLKDPTGIGPLDAILNTSGQTLSKGAGFGQNMLLEALLDPTSYIGIPGAKAVGKAATTPLKGVPDAATGSIDDLLKGLVGGLGEGADVSPGAVVGGLEEGLEGAPRAAAEVLYPMSPLKQRIVNLQDVTQGLQKLPPGTASPAEMGAAQDMVRGIGLPPDSPKFPAIPMGGPKPTQLEQILQLEAPKSLPGAQQVGVGTTEGMGILPEKPSYGVPEEVTAFLSDPQKVPAEFLSKAPEEKSFIDGIVRNEVERAVLEDAEEMGRFLRRNPGVKEKTLNFFRRYLGDKGKEFAREPGGGAVYQDLLQAHKKESEALDYVKGITSEAFGKYEKLNKFKKREVFKTIKQAVETGDTSGLRSPLEVELYDAYTKRQAIVTKVMEDAGLPVIKDKGYIRHQLETSKMDPESLFANQLPSEVKTSATKHRANIEGNYLEDDLVRLTETHDKAIFHKIAYDPVLGKVKETEGGLTPKLSSLIKTSVFPEKDPGGFFGWLTGLRFKTKLKYNPFSATENFAQRHLARGQVTGEANLLAKELIANERKLGLEDIFEGGVTSRANDMSAAEGLAQGGLFPIAERSNWRAARASGLAEEVVRHPEYQSLIKQGKSRTEAFMAVKDTPAWSNAYRNFVPQTVLERGKIRGEDLAASTQFVNAEGYRPKLFEAGAQVAPLKPFLQFKRFDASSFEAIKDMFTMSGKESRILRRGFADETSVVDALNARRTLRDGLKQNVKAKTVTKEMAGELIPRLDAEITRLEKVVREVEPGTKLNAAKHLGAFVGQSAAVRTARAGAKIGVFELLKETGLLPEEAKQASFEDSLYSAGQSILPGAGSIELLKSLAGYPEQNFGSKLPSELISAIPGVGYVEGSVPGRPLSTILKHRVTKPTKKKLKDLFDKPGRERPSRPKRPKRPERR